MKTETWDTIGNISTLVFRGTSVAAWVMGVKYLDSWALGVWLVAGLAWVVQDMATTIIVKRNRAEREKRPPLVTLEAVSGPEGLKDLIERVTGAGPPPPPKKPPN